MANKNKALEERLIFKISHPYLVCADRDMNQLNKLLCRLWTQLDSDQQNQGLFGVSNETIGKIYRLASSLHSRIVQRNFEVDNEFDAVVKTHLISCLRAVDGYMHYFHNTGELFHHRRGDRWDGLLEKMYGKGAYAKFENMCKSLDHTAKDEFHSLIEDLRYEPGTNDLPGFREKAQANLVLIEKMLEKYLEYTGFGKDLIEGAGLELSPPGNDFSFWEGSHFKLFFNPELLINDGGESKTKFFRGIWYLVGVHEFVGHALQAKFSSGMPRSLNLDPFTFNHITGGPNSEGVAMFVESNSLNWFGLKDSRSNFDLGDRDLRLMELYLPAYFFTKIHQCKSDLVDLRKRNLDDRSSSREYDEYLDLSSSTGTFVYRRDPNIIGGRTHTELIQDLSYLYGLRNVASVWNKFKRHIAETYHSHRRVFHKNHHLFLRGLLTGGFRPDAHYDFLTKVYLPRIEDLLEA